MPNPVFHTKHIAPCGINCGVCIAYLRKKKPCCGCNEASLNKPKHCISCRIRLCEHIAQTKSGLCHECIKFPCPRIKRLDARYRKNYHTSLIGNLKEIQANGIAHFLAAENEKWICPSCRQVMSIHREACLNCQK